jgi:hypothetical protein
MFEKIAWDPSEYLSFCTISVLVSFLRLMHSLFGILFGNLLLLFGMLFGTLLFGMVYEISMYFFWYDVWEFAVNLC